MKVENQAVIIERAAWYSITNFILKIYSFHLYGFFCMFLLANNNPVVPHQPRAILSNILLFSYSLLLLHPPKHCVKIVLYSELFWSAFPTNYFETMLLNMSDISMHHRNIQTLMIELFKIKYDLAPLIMDFLLNRRTICYNFRNCKSFSRKERELSFMV